MVTSLNKLLSLWLALALTIVPLPVFASAVGASGCDHSLMETVSTHADHQQPGCKHCQSHNCEDGSCTQQDCSTCFSNLITPSTFSVGDIALSKFTTPLTAAGLLSRSDPPPLRPPL